MWTLAFTSEPMELEMYIPSFNRIDDDGEIRRFVAAARSAEFVTVDPDGVPVATLLPIMWNDFTVVAHMARANPQWKAIGPDSPALLICSGPEAYISPSWYAAKAEHGKVVPTWNYSAVHLSGTVRVHENREWLRDAVTRLTGVMRTCAANRGMSATHPSATSTASSAESWDWRSPSPASRARRS